MKTCTKCNIEKPFEAFYKSKAKKDGHTPHCKECTKSRYRELKKSPLMQLEKQVRSSIMIENKLLDREGKKICSSCKNIFLIDDLIGRRCKNCSKKYNRKHGRKYKAKNKDNIKEYQKEYCKEYYEKNKDKYKERREKYRLKKKLEKELKS